MAQLEAPEEEAFAAGCNDRNSPPFRPLPAAAIPVAKTVFSSSAKTFLSIQTHI